MISGVGFMLYKNKKPTVSQSINVNLPTMFNNQTPAAIIGTNNQAAAGISQVSDINKINQDGGFNLNIFSSDKFKNLLANTFIIKESPATGKRNPFKPN